MCIFIVPLVPVASNYCIYTFVYYKGNHNKANAQLMLPILIYCNAKMMCLFVNDEMHTKPATETQHLQKQFDHKRALYS